MEEKILDTEPIYDGRIVKLDLHTVELPNNQQSKREVIHHPGAVVIAALDETDNILLVRQYRIAASQILTELPAGTLEIGEEPVECAIRELQEETGYYPNSIQSVGGFYPVPGYSTEYIHLFFARDLTLAPRQQDDDEFIELVRVPFTDAIDMIDTGEIIDCKTVAGILRLQRFLSKQND